MKGVFYKAHSLLIYLLLSHLGAIFYPKRLLGNPVTCHEGAGVILLSELGHVHWPLDPEPFGTASDTVLLVALVRCVLEMCG